MSVYLRRLIFPAIIFIVSSCTPPDDITTIPYTSGGTLLSIAAPDSVSAAADISVRIQKKSFSGNLVVKLKDTVFFDARIYSLLGIEVASIKENSQSVMLEYSDQSYTFSSVHAMDSLPFVWARAIGLREFQSFFSGNLVPLQPYINSKPDTTVVLKRNVMVLRWFIPERNLQLEMTINSKKTLPIQISLADLRPNSSWRIVFKNFRDGRAYSLLFKEDDFNYFSINYEKILFFNGTILL